MELTTESVSRPQSSLRDAPSSRSLRWFVVGLFGTMVIFHLVLAVSGRSIYRAIHLGTALEFGQRGVDLFHPTIVGFNATGTPTAEELPLWQATVGMAQQLTHSHWYGWATVVSLGYFALGLWPFFQLVRHFHGDRVAWWATAFFLAQPLSFLTAGFGSTDGFCLMLTIWFLFFADQLIRTGSWIWWLPTAIFAALASVSKAPFFLAAGLCSIGLLLLHRVRDWRRWAMLAGCGLAAFAVFVGWTHYTDSFAERAVYPYYELRLSRSPDIFYWYFGNWQTRLNLGLWLKGGWRFLHSTVGALPMAGLLLVALAGAGNSFAKTWLLATVLATLVFTHVVLIHWHYYLMCCPAVAILCGTTLARWDELWAQRLPQPAVRLALIGTVLIFSAIDGAISTKVAIYFDRFPTKMANLISRYTQPSDKLIVFGGDWGGEELFRSDRTGFYVYQFEDPKRVPTMKGLASLLTSDSDLARLKSLGYNKLVLISESPVRFAAVAGNPGSERQRFYYPQTISPGVDSWPTIYRDEDLWIKQIPGTESR